VKEQARRTLDQEEKRTAKSDLCAAASTRERREPQEKGKPFSIYSSLSSPAQCPFRRRAVRYYLQTVRTLTPIQVVSSAPRISCGVGNKFPIYPQCGNVYPESP